MAADTLVDLTDANFAFGTYAPFAPAGAITFPLDFTTEASEEFGFQASGLTLSAAPDAGCVRTVNSVTVAFAISSTAAAQGVSPALTFGTPNELAEDATYAYNGDGEFASEGEGGIVILPPSEAEQSGVITVAYAAPVDYSTALLALGFQNLQGESTDWSITSANFSVNDVCPDPVVPVVPAAEAPVVPTLANTGADLAPLMGTAGALLLAGIAGTAIASVRRRRAIR